MTLPLAVLFLLPQLFVPFCLLIPKVRWRTACAAILALSGAILSGMVIGAVGRTWTVLLAVLAIMQLINTVRIVENRMRREHLMRSVLQSWLMVFTTTVLLLGFVLLVDFSAVDYWFVLFVAACISCLVGTLVAITTVLHIYVSRPIRLTNYYSDDELPTVSVLVPARNEDNSLTDCIHSLLKSDYPKLEILVLDDCSQDRSSDIIRSFAHKGVRFIPGDPPREKWLAKNQAYQTLADAASSDWLLFSGVDVRFEVKTIRNIVTHAITRQKNMLGLLPQRTKMTWHDAWLSPLRYWYEMALPRTVVGVPPILSTCWLIENKYFKSLGGFEGVTRSVIPEIYFAKHAQKQKSYQFIRSSNDLVITTEKNLSEQYLTAIRTRYPQIKKRPEYALAAAVGLVLLALTSYGTAVVALIYQQPTIFAVSFAAAMLLSLSHIIVVYVTCKKAVVFAFVAFPILLVQEAYLMLLSMYKYEFSEVDWKGRNICYPIMHITKNLPSLD